MNRLFTESPVHVDSKRRIVRCVGRYPLQVRSNTSGRQHSSTLRISFTSRVS
jgi:hypothetical protein